MLVAQLVQYMAATSAVVVGSWRTAWVLGSVDELSLPKLNTCPRPPAPLLIVPLSHEAPVQVPPRLARRSASARRRSRGASGSTPNILPTQAPALAGDCDPARPLLLREQLDAPALAHLVNGFLEPLVPLLAGDEG